MVTAEEIFRKLLAKIAEQYEYKNYSVKVQTISSGGANYTTVLFIATISAPQRKDLQLFAKVANVPENIRKQSPIPEAFKQEHHFYTELIKTLENLEKKHGIAEEHKLVTAKYYGSSWENLQEAIVLENLSAKGYELYDRMKSVSREYAEKAVEVLAKFHALSFAYLYENPEEFKKTSFINFDTCFGNDVKQMFTRHMFGAAYKVLRDENKEKVQKYFNEGDRFQEWANCYRPITRPVLGHGDYRPSNLMYRRHNGKQEIIPLDFQLLHIGSPAYDLLYFIYLGTDAEFRKSHYNNLIEHYYSQLRLALQRLHLDINNIYPRKHFETDLKTMIGLNIGLTLLALVTVDEENTPEFSINFQLEPSDVYRQRINEIVDEYVEKGLLK